MYFWKLSVNPHESGKLLDFSLKRLACASWAPTGFHSEGPSKNYQTARKNFLNVDNKSLPINN